MSDDDLTKIRNEDNYHFDYYALSKLKDREQKKLFVLGTIIGVLCIIDITFIVLYHNCKTVKSSTHVTTFQEVLSARAKAYSKIASRGNDCSKNYKCPANADCLYMQGSYRCDCRQGFYGENCKNGSFGIHFKTPTNSSTDIPLLSGVQFPKSDGLSVCFWFAMTRVPVEMSAFFMYHSVYTATAESDLMISIDNQTNFWLTFKGSTHKLYTASLQKSKWNHICWVWYSQWWKFYLNGKQVTSKTNKEELSEPFPESKGKIILGQHLVSGRIAHKGHMFLGEMTELFIYSRHIQKHEVMAAYQNHAGIKNATVGWWRFQDSTKGKNVVITRYPLFGIFIQNIWQHG